MTTTTTPPRTLTPYACTRCDWRGPLTEAVHNRATGTACPRCRAPLATAASLTTHDDATDALFTLLAAVCAGHIRWSEGTRGHREARHAIKQAREVLLKSKWRVQTAELRPPADPATIEDALPDQEAP